MMSGLMSDVLAGSVTPDVANAVCNAGGKLLKMVELEYKFATEPGLKSKRSIAVAPRQHRLAAV